ncbi:MAG TPA: SusE domain-containing protein [Ohtaekwangia sp.]
MKNILIYISAVFMLFSCEKDETMVKVTTEVEVPVITSHENGFAEEITKNNLSEEITFTWDKADYGVNTPLTYLVEIDSAGRSFSNPTVVGVTTDSEFTITLGELNDKLLNELKVTKNEESALELRVRSTVNYQLEEISPVIDIKVKTYKVFATLWVPGGYQGWSPGTAPVIYESGDGKFEGYVYIQEGTGFKFTSAPDWDHINYGDSGTYGLLTTDGSANGMSASQPGYYRFKVDVENLTYEMYRVESFGLIGTATSGDWDNSTPMTFNTTTGLWSVTTDLEAGALKFRANNGWELNYGTKTSNSYTGTLVHVDDAITIAEAGNYTVTIDLSRSGDDHVYTYAVVKN